MKLLLIGFHKYDDNMYPHLRCFIDRISSHCDLTYFHFRERGYFIEHIMKRPFKLNTWAIACFAIFYSVIDSLRLLLKHRDHDVVIAIDHYAYAVASLIFEKKRVILWSHDIISHESAMRKNFFVRAFMNLCSKALAHHKKLIIQDEERLRLLKESLRLNGHEMDIFYMPVFLEGTDIGKRELSSAVKPRLLQCGGIGAYRSSDKLLMHYQENHLVYRLYMHGFLFDEIRALLSRCDIQPMVSTRTISPRHLHRLVDYCDIGFVGYEQEDLNFYYIAKSSGQLVEFLRVGMPVIVMGQNDLHAFVEEQGIGTGIRDISELNKAIEAVVKDYERYSRNCFRCFDLYFNYEKYIPRIVSWL